MNRALEEESEKLAGSWMQHEAGWLRDYLVAGVEDPRINAQSILTRHFLIREISGDRFSSLMKEEYKFSAAMNWILKLAEQPGGFQEFEPLLFALRRGADNAEGMEIPAWLLQVFASMPVQTEAIHIPNYIERLLSMDERQAREQGGLERTLNTLCDCWAQALPRLQAPESAAEKATVLEPACGSANDYRFLQHCGITAFIDYQGFDLCEKNVENARSLFPGAHFARGNVFEIASADKSFELCIVHDLFEHLSLEGLAEAVKEICRVTRGGICAGFFQMDEIAEHVVRPVDQYHWNLLSMKLMKEAFEKHGFSARVLHVGTFIRQATGCGQSYNPDAYTLILHADSKEKSAARWIS